MATQDEKNDLLTAIHNCMVECQAKARDNSLAMQGRNVFVTANIQFIPISGKLYLRNPTTLDSELIWNAIRETNEATTATHNAHDQASIGFAAIQLSEAIWACYQTLNS